MLELITFRETCCKEKLTMEIRRKIKGIFPVLILSLMLNTGITNGRTLSAGKKYSSSPKTLRSMARVYMAYGEYAKAQPLAEQALTLAKRNGASNSELAMCLIDLATLYKGQNNLSDAEEMCELGLKLQEKALYRNHPYVAYTLRTLSSIYSLQTKYSQAESTLDKAMSVMLDSHSANDKAMAPFFVDIGKLNVAQGRLGEAEDYYKKAMSLINSSYGPNHLYTANVLGDIAKLYTLQGRYSEAEKMINRTVATQEKVYGSDHHLIAPSWLTKAKVCRIKGDRIKAERLIRRALAAVEKTGNTAALAKLEQDVRDIRVGELVAYGTAGKTIK